MDRNLCRHLGIFSCGLRMIVECFHYSSAGVDMQAFPVDMPLFWLHENKFLFCKFATCTDFLTLTSIEIVKDNSWCMLGVDVTSSWEVFLKQVAHTNTLGSTHERQEVVLLLLNDLMQLPPDKLRELLGPAMTDGVVPIELIDRGDSSRSATNILLHAALQRKDIIKDIRLS